MPELQLTTYDHLFQMTERLAGSTVPRVTSATMQTVSRPREELIGNDFAEPMDLEKQLR